MALQSTNSPSRPVQDEWTIITHEEATGHHTDRILILLDSHKTPYPILLDAVPTSSLLLTQLANLEPCQRHLHLVNLTVAMVQSYCQIRPVDLQVAEYTWATLIDLTITAEIMQDPVVETGVLVAMKKKGVVAEQDVGKMYTVVGYEAVSAYRKATGGGDRLLKTLDEIQNVVREKKKLIVTDKLPRAVWGAGSGSSSGKGKTDEADGPKAVVEQKIYSSRQPSIPLSVDALRTRTVGAICRSAMEGTKETRIMGLYCKARSDCVDADPMAHQRIEVHWIQCSAYGDTQVHHDGVPISTFTIRYFNEHMVSVVEVQLDAVPRLLRV